MAPSPNIIRDRQGVVYVEFLLVFPPLFLLFLVIVQSAILRTGSLGVQHAASSAVRSAIVILPDEPRFYGGDAKNKIPESGNCGEGFAAKVHSLLGKGGLDTHTVPEGGQCPGGPRMEAIRFAATMRMLPFAPNPQSIAPEAFRGVLNSLGTIGGLAGAAAYSLGATAVTFVAGPDDHSMRPVNDFSDSENVTVRVTYLAHCGIPIARFFMCDSSHSLVAEADLDFFRRNASGRYIVGKRIKNASTALAHMAEGVGNRGLLLGLMASGARFHVMSADATLPLNSAPYLFESEKQNDEELD